MPIIKSAKKRVRQSNKAAVRNSKLKRSLKRSLKLVKANPSLKSYSSAYSNIDKAAKKRVIHKNKAARLKKRAAAQAKAGKLNLSKGSAKSPTPAKAKKAPPKKKPAPKKTSA